MTSSNSRVNHIALYEISIGAMLITIVGLVLMLAVMTYMLETNQPAKMFPLTVSELWKPAYGQEQKEEEDKLNEGIQPHYNTNKPTPPPQQQLALRAC